MKKITIWLLYLIALTFLFISCGEGGGNNDSDKQRKQYSELPPDPGAAGKATLEGIDSNNNGVRDDVEIAIWKYAPAPNEEDIRQALFQSAKDTQAAVLAGAKDDIDAALKAHEEGGRSISCAIKKSLEMGRKPTMLKNTDEVSMIERLVANTNERAKAYIHFNGMMSGRVFRLEDYAIPCDSDRAKEAKAQAAFNAQTFNVQSAYNLPPDPGLEGKKTLEGIDSNNNGVRDDVEIAIYNYAPRPDQERYRAAITQMAKAMQETLIIGGSSDSDKVLKVDYRNMRAINCTKKTSLSGYASEELKFLQGVIYNTRQRENVDVSYRNAKKNIFRKNPELRTLTINDPVPCDYDKR